MNTSATQKRNAAVAETSAISGPDVASVWSNARISALDFTASAGTAVAALSINSSLLLYSLNSENRMFELAPRGSSWSALDMSPETFVQPLSDVTAVWLGARGKRVYCQSPQNQIYEFQWNGSSSEEWVVSVISGSAAIASNTPLGSLAIADLPHVYYIAPDNKVHELDYQEGKGWINTNLTADAKSTSAHPAQPLSPLTVTTAFNGPYPRVYFLDDANHVCELAWTGQSPWKFRDLTTDTGVSPAQGHSPLASMAVKGNPQVYYLGLDNELHELFWDGVSKWHDRNLTMLATDNAGVKVYPPAARSPLACALFGDISRVFYLGNDLAAHQMTSGPEPADFKLTTATSLAVAGLSPLTAVNDANGLHVIYNTFGSLAQFVSPAP